MSTAEIQPQSDSFDDVLRAAGLELPPDLFSDSVLPDEDIFLPCPAIAQKVGAVESSTVSVRSFPFLDDELEFFAMQRYPLAETLPARELKARIALHAHILFINVIVKQQLPETPLVGIRFISGLRCGGVLTRADSRASTPTTGSSAPKPADWGAKNAPRN